MIRIGDFARLADVSVRTLRFYDETHLLRPMHIDPVSGYRHYQATQLTLLYQIRALQELGFSLAAIREMLRRDLPVAELRATMQQRRTELGRQIRGDMRRLRQVDACLRNATNDQSQSTVAKVLVRQTKDSWVASLREKIRGYDEAEALFSELERKVPAHLLTAKRSALWHACEQDGGPIDCEVLRSLKGPCKSGPGFRSYQLGAGTVASVFHTGSEETMGESYRTLTRWMASSGFRLSGAKREIYWIEKDARSAQESLTEIQFPIALSPSRRSQWHRAA